MTAPPSMRESFESWQKNQLDGRVVLRGAEINGKWTYVNFLAQIRWEAWQASAASMAEQAAKVIQEYSDRVLHVYARGPNDPPGNQWVTTKREHLVEAIRSLKP